MPNAIRITEQSLRHILGNMKTEEERAEIAFALLTSTYNGERWYFVSGNLNAPFKVDYTKQIMNEEKLRKMFNYASPARVEDWFTVNSKS